MAPRLDDAPTVVSTFAGCGGSSLGFSIAGYRELLAVEYDDHAVQTFKLNFEGTPVFHGDIADLSVEEALNLCGIGPGELDVLDGSPPCQGFSTAGHRVMDDPRNSLFREFVRLLDGLRPRAFVMENVSGMVKGKMKLIFADILRMLRDCGYRVSARLLNAMYFQVPQSRQRMIFVGVREDLGVEPSHPRPINSLYPVSMAIGDFGNEPDIDSGHSWVDESPQGRNTKTWIKAHYAAQGVRYAGQIKRDRWGQPASTLLTSGFMKKYCYLRNSSCHPLYTRPYSAAERKRIASFPDQFVFVGTQGEIASRIGNCVPPLFMRAVAEHVRTAILNASQ